MHKYEFRVTENAGYPTYNIKRKNILELNDIEINNKNSLSEKQPGFHKINDNKRVILVDDEEDILFTYKLFLENDYDVTSFIDPVFALNFIRNIPILIIY